MADVSKNRQMPEAKDGAVRVDRKTGVRYISQILIFAICITMILICIFRAAFDSELWGGSKRYPGGLVNLNLTQYLTGTERIEEYGGIRRTYTLPPIPLSDGYQYLAVWLVHSYIEIWAGDDLIYERKEPEEPHIGHTPGNYWALVPLTEADALVPIRLVVTPAYSNVADTTPQLYASTIRNIFNERMKGEQSLLIISLFCVIEGILFSLFTLIMRVPGKTGQSVFYMGLMIADLGIWKLFDLPGLAILFPKANTAFTYTSFFALMMLIPAVTCFLSWREAKTGVYTILCEVFLLFDIVLITLHVTGVSDLRSNLALIQAALVISLAVVLEKSIINIGKKLGDWQAWACIILAIASLTDFVIYYYISNTLHLGITLTLMFFYGLAYGAMVLHGVRMQRELLEKREMELKEKQLALMMSQIRPHFLYNTLNTIYTLCRKDGEEAGKMILDLAGYLRINFENMDSIVPVPFKDELAHTRFYLSIEKRRFGDDISVVYDIATENFTLPALSLQPLVENAVKHGIRKSKESGTVTIRTWEEQDGVHLIVEDDGEGFDTSAWVSDPDTNTENAEAIAHRKNVGLKNVRDRIRDMCGGRMEIQSIIGEGTKVLLIIPVSQQTKKEEAGKKKIFSRREKK